MHYSFNHSDAIKRSWRLLMENKILIVFTLIYFIIYVVNYFSMENAQQIGSYSVVFMSNILMVIIALIFQIGIIRTALQITRGHKLTNNEIKRNFWMPKLWIPVFVISVLYALMFFVGFLFLIIPGIWIMIRLTFSVTAYIDRKEGFSEAFARSWEITKNNFWEVLLYYIISFGLTLLGLICLGVGIIFTLPLIYIYSIMLYRTISGESDVPAEQDLYEMHIVD